jgi:two-component system response regulator
VPTPALLPLVVIVEDDPLESQWLETSVRDAGVKNPVVILADGTAAMNYFQRWLALEQGNWISQGLVLLDLKMPGASGFDVLTWIRDHERLRALPIIVVTASADPAHEARALRLGATCSIAKDNASELRAAIQRAMNVHALHG